MNESSKTRIAGKECFEGGSGLRMLEFINDAVFLRFVTAERSDRSFAAVNGVACQRLGYSREELEQKSPTDIGLEVTEEQLKDRAKQLLAEGSLVFESELLAKDGRRLPVEISSRLFEWDGRQMTLSIARDLTERKQAEDAMRASEENFRSMFANAPIGIYQSTLTQLRAVNPALVKMFGYESAEEALAKGMELTSYYADSGQRQKLISEAMESKTHTQNEVEYRRKDGSTFTANLRMRAVRDNAGGIKYFEGFIEDISQRKRAERDVKRLSQWLLRTQRISKVGGWAINMKTGEVWVSPEARRIYGVSEGEPMALAQVQSFPLPRYRSMLDAALSQLVEKGKSYDVEFQISRRADNAVVDIHSLAEFDAGEAVILGVIEDITERKRLAEQLRQAQKMEAIGQLAGGVAHDFNNILSATLMHLGLLQENPQLPDSAKETLNELEREAALAASLTRQLLLFSRRQLARVEPLDLNELIKTLLKMLRRLLDANIEVTFQGSADAVWVNADAGMVEQVVMNLCINARDAMPRGGKLALCITQIEIDSEAARGCAQTRVGRFVCLSVSDTGCGMDAPVLEKIFEPFFTTKEAGQGTGLGLATVSGIVRQHQGWIKVESAVGQGTSFHVYFPGGIKPLGEAANFSDKEVARGTETILVVEDELPLRRLTSLSLRKLGYTVWEAGDGLEALKVWEQHACQIALLIADMMMPESLTGLDLAERFRKEKASLKVIISSGYSADLERSLSTTAKEVDYLPKPYNLTALAKAVRRCLDQDETSNSDMIG